MVREIILGTTIFNGRKYGLVYNTDEHCFYFKNIESGQLTVVDSNIRFKDPYALIAEVKNGYMDVYERHTAYIDDWSRLYKFVKKTFDNPAVWFILLFICPRAREWFPSWGLVA